MLTRLYRTSSKISEIRTFSDWELLKALILDPANSGQYRKEIDRRCPSGVVEDWVTQAQPPKPDKSSRDTEQEEEGDIYARTQIYKEDLQAALDLIIDSGWDFTDESIKLPPENIEDLLRSMRAEEANWEELSVGRKNAFQMILGAYRRWYLRKNKRGY